MTTMFSGIFQSKFIPPKIPSTFITRSRLQSKLQEGMKRKLTLITAPAGFGKSLLVAHWLKSIDCPYIWISIQREDSNPYNLAKTFIRGASKLKKNWGENILKNTNLLNTNIYKQLTPLVINELEELSNNLVIIIDDFRHIDSNLVSDNMVYFINNMPTKCHLYVISRHDPHIPLARLRIREELIEINKEDLKFSLTETDEFFSRNLNFPLTSEKVKYFHRIFDGWISGLVMIQFSIKTRKNAEDTSKIIADISRDLSMYFEEEVFCLQSEKIQSFLLATSILSTLTPSLCDAVTERTDSGEILERLEKLNLFIILIDYKSSLYRYHHFFSDMLQVRLKKTWPDKISELHYKASKWYLDNNLIDNAIFHAHASGNEEFYADIVEMYVEETLLNGELSKVENWINQTPEHILENRPKLIIAKSIYLILSNPQIKEIEEYNSYAEKILFNILNSKENSMDQQEKEDLHSMIWTVLFIKAFVFAMYNDFDQAKNYCRKSMEFVPQDGFRDTITHILYGFCNLVEGKIDDAEIISWEAKSLSHKQVEHNLHIDVFNKAMKIFIELYQGKLSKADRFVSKAIEKYKNRINRQEVYNEPAAFLLVIKGEILREMDQLDEAEEMLSKGIKLMKYIMPPNFVAFGYICLSRIKAAKGDFDNAMAIANRAEKEYWPVNLFLTDYLPAYKAMLDIKAGKLKKASQFVQKSDFSKNGKIMIKNDIHYSEFLTIARYYISSSDCDKALNILEKIKKKSKTESRTKRYLEALILSSLALKKSGRTEESLSKLSQAIKIAAPEGFCRIFIDEGDEIIEMLDELLKNSNMFDIKQNIFYIKHLLKKDKPIKNHMNPLTKRELEILLQISKGLTNNEISEKLYISPDTVKSHVHKVISKLDVDNRSKAVIKARKIGLIE